jgi:hypothetical protein
LEDNIKTDGRDIRDLWKWNVNRTGLESCPVSGFGFSSQP